MCLKSIKTYPHIQNGEIIGVSSTRNIIFVGQGVYLYFYDEKIGELLQQYYGEDRRIYGLSVDVNKKQIVIETKKKVKCWEKRKNIFRVISEKDILNQKTFLITDKISLLSNDNKKCLVYESGWDIMLVGDEKKISYLRYLDGNKFRECLYVAQWSQDDKNIVGIDWKLNFFVWDIKTGKVLEFGVIKEGKLGLIESVLLGKNNKYIFLNNQEGDLWRIVDGKLEKLHSGCAFGTLKNIDDETFLAKNCDYTILHIFHSETGKILGKLVSIEGITVLGSLFNNTDFDGDMELKGWIVSNGGIL